MLPQNAPAWLNRLSTWLEPFETCFSHVAQRGVFRRYLAGLLSDSRRKSMSAMWARISDPGSYQAFQHFITHAPWAAEAVWRQLRAQLPDREGMLILDGTSFPKQGGASVGVARQYCGALGKVANCQTAVTAALWTGARAWCVGAALYLPEQWLTSEARTRARIPAAIAFKPKSTLALTLLRQVRASGLRITAVLGDAEFGDCARLRRTLHAAGLPYALGVSSTLTCFRTRPRVLTPTRQPGQRGRLARRTLADAPTPESVRAITASLPRTAWRRIRWCNGTQPERTAYFVALRVTPAHGWRRIGLAPDVWLLLEREAPTAGRTRAHLVHLPATTSLRALVRLAHQRWAIEQQYQELKGELGLDHFEGRSFPGWHRHVVLTALAYAWLQTERRRRGPAAPTLPVVRAVITEILTAHFFVTRPHYLETMLKLRTFHLRI